jgi:hypothetical protein
MDDEHFTPEPQCTFHEAAWVGHERALREAWSAHMVHACGPDDSYEASEGYVSPAVLLNEVVIEGDGDSVVCVGKTPLM